MQREITHARQSVVSLRQAFVGASNVQSVVTTTRRTGGDLDPLQRNEENRCIATFATYTFTVENDLVC